MRNFDEFVKLAAKGKHDNPNHTPDYISSYTVKPNTKDYHIDGKIYDADEYGRLSERKPDSSSGKNPYTPTQEELKARRDRALKAEHDRESARRDSWIDPYGEDIPHDK